MILLIIIKLILNWGSLTSHINYMENKNVIVLASFKLFNYLSAFLTILAKVELKIKQNWLLV